MSKISLITKLAVAVVVAGVPLSAIATSTDYTGTGSVSLARPGYLKVGAIEGFVSNLSYSAAVRSTLGNTIVAPAEGASAQATGQLNALARIANKQVLQNAVGNTVVTGWSLILLHKGNAETEPVVYAYNKKLNELKPVNMDNQFGLQVGFDWLDFIGVYKGTATLQTTGSGTFASAGSLSGFTAYNSRLNLTVNGNEDVYLEMDGIGSFTQSTFNTNRLTGGITGRASLAGAYAEPVVQ